MELPGKGPPNFRRCSPIIFAVNACSQTMILQFVF